MTEVHPDLAPLAPLIGEWEGEGHGSYPTIEPFDYRERVTFVNPPGKPFLAYSQRTWAIDDGRPLHAEAGYVRPGLHGSWEWMNAQPSGFVEVYAGALDGATLRFESSLIARTPTAKRVDRLRRVVHMAGSSIDYTLEMAAVGHPLQLHLTALLRRVAN